MASMSQTSYQSTELASASGPGATFLGLPLLFVETVSRAARLGWAGLPPAPAGEAGRLLRP